MPRRSTYQREHPDCARAAAEARAELERLRAENDRLRVVHRDAIEEVERSTQRWATLTSTRAALVAERDRLQTENERLNRLVETLSRALARYQDEGQEVGGDEPADHPYQRRGSWSSDDWCAVEGCTSKASAHP